VAAAGVAFLVFDLIAPLFAWFVFGRSAWLRAHPAGRILATATVYVLYATAVARVMGPHASLYVLAIVNAASIALYSVAIGSVGLTGACSSKRL
jgi:hypothetical protein